MSTLRTVISGLWKVIALPLWLISGIAFLLFGFQGLLALANVLHGLSIVDALLLWVTDSIVLAIVAFVTGGLALLISGGESRSSTAAVKEQADSLLARVRKRPPKPRSSRRLSSRHHERIVTATDPAAGPHA